MTINEEDFESYLASATYFLIQGQENEAADLLLSCSRITIFDGSFGWEVSLFGPRTLYDELKKQKSPIQDAIREAFRAVLPEIDGYGVGIYGRAELLSIDQNWRKEFKEQVSGKYTNNQANNASNIYYWNGFRFRSPNEVKIAEALDKANVLFFPDCKCRLKAEDNESGNVRINREPDFLVCYKGKWGILEVDSRTFHTSAAEDHERDRLFRYNGIKIIERYTSTQCFKDPNGVVRQFLSILGNS